MVSQCKTNEKFFLWNRSLYYSALSIPSLWHQQVIREVWFFSLHSANEVLSGIRVWLQELEILFTWKLRTTFSWVSTWSRSLILSGRGAAIVSMDPSWEAVNLWAWLPEKRKHISWFLLKAWNCGVRIWMVYCFVEIEILSRFTSSLHLKRLGPLFPPPPACFIKISPYCNLLSIFFSSNRSQSSDPTQTAFSFLFFLHPPLLHFSLSLTMGEAQHW